MTSDDETDRIAYLSGEGGDSLTPEDRAELDELRAALSEPATWAEPDRALEDAVVAAVVAEAGQGASGAPSRWAELGRRLVWPGRWLGVATVGAAAVVAVVIAVGTRSSAPAPQRLAMVVSGTYLAPGAHGSAIATKMESGWQIKLSATGLPRLSGSRYYQAWLKNAHGILVPIGTFNDARQVTLWSGVPVTMFGTLSVTEQRANGDSASSGLRVLVGTIRPTL
ncbi:MAG TPA: anti-sigma factor [Solirubrobacteraceae bacterium]